MTSDSTSLYGQVSQPVRDKHEPKSDGDHFEVVSASAIIDDEAFGDFESATDSTQNDDSWVTLDDDDFKEDMEASTIFASTAGTFIPYDTAHSPPPSPPYRGYLRSTQDLDAFLPMKFAAETSALGNLLSFESSTYGDYAPLVGADSSAASAAAHARYASPAERLWSRGRTAFSKLVSSRPGVSKQAKDAVATWKTNFVASEHAEFAQALKAAGKAPMVTKVAAVGSVPARADVAAEVSDVDLWTDLAPTPTSGVLAHIPEVSSSLDASVIEGAVGLEFGSWMDEERQVWTV